MKTPKLWKQFMCSVVGHVWLAGEWRRTGDISGIGMDCCAWCHKTRVSITVED